MKIRAYTDYNEWNNKRYYTDFEIVDKLPEVGEVIYGDDDNCLTLNYGERERVFNISEAYLDFDQCLLDIYSYDFYEVVTQFEKYDNDTKSWLVVNTCYDTLHYAIEKEKVKK